MKNIKLNYELRKIPLFYTLFRSTREMEQVEHTEQDWSTFFRAHPQ